MGRKNAEVIRACERARRDHGEHSDEFRRAVAVVDATQAGCAHREQRTIYVSKTTSRYVKGQRMVYCLDCSLPLSAAVGRVTRR